MLHTPACDLLGIQVPIIQAGMASFTSPELVAAVSNAGALGSVGTGTRTTAAIKEQLSRTLELTDCPFAVNFTLSPLLPDPEAFAFTLELKPRLISLSLGEPDEYVKRAHDAGILVMHQVADVQQAYRAVASGVDIIIAQGSEAGGFGGVVAGLALIPQVVDAVSPIPVIAAGGIADGRGLAAALALGAQGVNIGTRFVASVEAPVSMQWKQAILSAKSQDTIKADFWSDIFPPGPRAYGTTPRVLTSPFVEEWRNRPEEISQQADRLRGEVGAAIAHGQFGELFPFTGETAGLIKEILPAAEIVQRIIEQAEQALKQAGGYIS